MSLKVTVKVGAVNNLSDARYCAGMSVDFIGFDFNPSSSNYTSPEKFKEISEWLSGVEFVAEFGDASLSEIEKGIAACDVNFIQVDNPKIVSSLEHLNKKIILSQTIETLGQLPEDISVAYVIVSGKNNTITKDEKEVLKEFASKHQILLGTGVTAQTAEQLVNDTAIKGIALKGGDEIRPGFKDYDELADILEELEVLD